MSSLLELLRVKWDAPYRFAASVLGLAGVIGLFLKTGPLSTLSGAALWAGLRVVQPWLSDAHHWLMARSGVIALASAAVILMGLVTACFGERGASSAVIGVAASLEVGSWALVVAMVLVAVCWVVIRVYDLVGDDPEGWRLLSGINRVLAGMSAASLYSIALPFARAFVRV